MPDEDLGIRHRPRASQPLPNPWQPARPELARLLRGSAAGVAAAILLAGSAMKPGPAAQAVDAGEVTVQINGVRNDRGVIRAALYDSPAGWNSDKGPGASAAVQLQDAPIRGGTATLRFTGVPYGRYALRAFHDEDRSGRFHTGLFGIPRVDVIFSNDVPIWQGPPSFAKASFPVKAPLTTLVLRAQRI